MRRLAVTLLLGLLLAPSGAFGDMYQDGSNAAQPQAANYLARPGNIFYAQAFGNCTWSAGGDVGPCVNAALAAAAVAGGGAIMAPAGNFGLSTKIVWPLAGAVRLLCPAGGGSDNPATTFKWTGAAGGRMVEIKPTAGHITGPAIQYCAFDGNAKLAADGIYAASTHAGRFENLTFKGGFNGGAVFTLTVEAGGADAQNNIIESLYIDSDTAASTSTQLYLGAYINPATGSGANASLNYIRNYSIVNNTGTGTAIVCEGCDNNYFSGRIYSPASVDLKVKVVGAHMFGANGNVFAPAIQYTGTFIARGQTTTPACVPYTNCTHSNSLLIDSTNSAPAPTIEPGADLQWGGNHGYRAGTMLIGDAKPALVAANQTVLTPCRVAAEGSFATQYLCNTYDSGMLTFNSLNGDVFSYRLSGDHGAKNFMVEHPAGTGAYEFVPEVRFDNGFVPGVALLGTAGSFTKPFAQVWGNVWAGANSGHVWAIATNLAAGSADANMTVQHDGATVATFAGNGVTRLEGLEVLPASPGSGSACVPGRITVDATFIYVCTAANSWKRAALSAF